ncbi:MAG: PEP-CTERM sorting domain-containing protein [Candidatus Thiodiazotropha taylori]
MKAFLGICFVVFLALSGYVQAVPLYFTFDGSIQSSIADDAGAITDAGLSINDAISYTFLIDFDEQASRINNDGTTYVYPDTINNDHFFADHIGSGALGLVDAGFYNAPSNAAEYNYGQSNISSGPWTQIIGGSENHFIAIYGPIDTINWIVGAALQSDEVVFNSSGGFSHILSSLTISGITEVVPTSNVPEPSTLLLMSIGMIGLGATRLRKTI